MRRGRTADKPAVFISYRRDDSGDVTGRIRDRVAAAVGDDHVFMDIDSIPLGADFRTHIADSVGRCDAVLAIVGPRWLDPVAGDGTRRIDQAEDFVRLELETALERGIPVVPVLVLGAQPLAPTDLPESLRDLAFRQATSVRRDPDFHVDMDRLLGGVLAPAQPPPEPVATSAEAARPDRAGATRGSSDSARSRRRIVAFVVALLVVAGAVGLVLALAGGDNGKPAAGEASPRATTTAAPSDASTPPADSSADAPLVIEQQGDTLVTRGYTMKLGKDWAVSGPGDDFVDFLGHSTHVFLTGPSPSYGDSVEFLVRDEAAGSSYRSHEEPTVREIDGVKVGQFRATTDSTTEVVAIAVVGQDKYGFELSVFNSEKQVLDQAVDDFERMLSSIRWKRE